MYPRCVPLGKAYMERLVSCSRHALVMSNMMMAPTYLTAIAPFCLGVVMHFGFFIRGEWHLQAPTIFIAHSIALVLLFARQLISSLPLWYGVAIPSVAYLYGLLSSLAVYRLFLHRLRSFPGPRMAAVSKLWHVFLCRDSRNHLVLESWRQKYGTFVRTGEFVSFNWLPMIAFAHPYARPERSHYLSSRWTRMARRTPESQYQKRLVRSPASKYPGVQ